VHEVAKLVRRSPYTVRRRLREGRLKGIGMKGEVPGDDDARRAPYLIPREEVARPHAKGWIRTTGEQRRCHGHGGRAEALRAGNVAEIWRPNSATVLLLENHT
jgi:hypothetical protein